jgi:hypothetical protein
MAEKTLVMTFLNSSGSKASISLPGVRDNVTQEEISTAMDVIIAKNIFQSSGGDLITRQAAQITEKNVTTLEVR